MTSQKKKLNKTAIKTVSKYKKDQLIRSSKYTKYRDFLTAMLDPDTDYEIKEIDELILINYNKKGRNK